MVRLWLTLGVIAAAFYIYSIVDCALFERDRVRALPKPAWVAIVILFPMIGSVLWFLFGRTRRSGQSRAVAPDDDIDFLGTLGKVRKQNPRAAREQEERIRQMEKDLAELDETNKENGDTDQPGRRDA